MQFSEISPKYFVLRDDIQLRLCDGYVMLYGFSVRNRKIITPWEALVLALCNGKVTLPEIVYIFGKTFDLDYPEASNVVTSTLESNLSYIKTSENPIEYSNRYDPLGFIMSSKIDEIGIGKLPLDPPWEVGLVTSYRCNFNCRYCYLPGLGDAISQPPVSCSFETCQKVIEEACSWGVPFIGIFGGEPLLFPKWDELAEQVISGGSVPLITTNGSLIGKREAERIAEIGIRQIVVSLEATNDEMFFDITRAPTKSFSRALNAISFLRENGVSVVIKGVCMPQNIHAIGELIDLVVDFGVEAIHFSRMERGHPSGPSWHCSTATEEDLENVRLITRQRSKEYGITITGPREQYDEAFSCGSLHIAMGVRPPGIVGICSKFDGNPEFDLGDVREQSLKQIWYGKRAENFRKRCIDPVQVGSRCSSCSKLQNCMTGCFFDSYIATGKYLAPPPYCKKEKSEIRKINHE